MCPASRVISISPSGRPQLTFQNQDSTFVPEQSIVQAEIGHSFSENFVHDIYLCSYCIVLKSFSTVSSTDCGLLKDRAGVLFIFASSRLSTMPRTSEALRVLLEWRNEDKEREHALDHETFPSTRET